MGNFGLETLPAAENPFVGRPALRIRWELAGWLDLLGLAALGTPNSLASRGDWPALRLLGLAARLGTDGQPFLPRFSLRNCYYR
jgi:hypothetical protein